MEPTGSAADALRSSLEERLASHDRPGTVTEALRTVAAGRMDIATLYSDVLTPLLNDLGARWQNGSAAVWEEHLASATVRTIIDALYPRVLSDKAKVPPSGRSVLLACPENESHDLGLRMLSDLFDLSGWTTNLLGPDCPTDEIANAATSLGVDLVVLTSATHFHRVRLHRILEDLHEQLPGLRLVVAGGVFIHDTEGLRPDEVFRAAEFFPWAAPEAEGR